MNIEYSCDNAVMSTEGTWVNVLMGSWWVPSQDGLWSDVGVDK